MKTLKEVATGVFGLIILFFSLSVAFGTIAPIANNIDLTDLITASAIGAIFGSSLIYLSFLIAKDRSNNLLENGLVTLGLGLLLLFFWPYRQFHYWKTSNSDYSSSSLVLGSVVTIATILRGMWFVYKQKKPSR